MTERGYNGVSTATGSDLSSAARGRGGFNENERHFGAAAAKRGRGGRSRNAEISKELNGRLNALKAEHLAREELHPDRPARIQTELDHSTTPTTSRPASPYALAYVSIKRHPERFARLHGTTRASSADIRSTLLKDWKTLDVKTHNLDRSTGLALIPLLSHETMLKHVNEEWTQEQIVSFIKKKRDKRRSKARVVVAKPKSAGVGGEGETAADKLAALRVSGGGGGAAEAEEKSKTWSASKLLPGRAMSVARNAKDTLTRNTAKRMQARAEQDLRAHLNAIRPVTVPPKPRTPQPQPQPPDWERILGPWRPEDSTKNMHWAWKETWTTTAKSFHLSRAADLRRVLLRSSSRPRTPLDPQNHVRGLDPTEQEELNCPRAFGTNDPRFAWAPAEAGRQVPSFHGVDGVGEDVDGSLLSASDEGQARWVCKVGKEMRKINHRIWRLITLHQLHTEARTDNPLDSTPTPQDGGGAEALHGDGEATDAKAGGCAGDADAAAEPASGAAAAALGAEEEGQALTQEEILEKYDFQVGSARGELRLGMVPLTAAQICALGLCLSQGVNSYIKRLTLSGNCIDDGQLTMFLTALEGTRELEYLNLANNGITEPGARALSQTLHRGTSKALKGIVLAGNAIKDRGVRVLAEGMLAHGNLEEVDLCKTCCTHVGAQAVALVLENSRTLRILRLSWNLLGKAGGLSLCEAMRHSPCLEQLALDHSSLGDAGAGYVAEALRENRSLKRLDLSANQLSMQCCHVIAAGLKMNRNLHELILDHNPLGLQGAGHLMECVANQYVRHLSLQSCSLTTMRTLESKDIMYFNAQRPNRKYDLDLHDPADFLVGIQLAWRWHTDGSATWVKASFNGKPLYLSAEDQWPERLPHTGNLQVDFNTGRVIADPRLPATDEQFVNIFGSLLQKSAPVTDAWRKEFVTVVSTAYYLSAPQISRVISAFSFHSEIVQATLHLVCRMQDPYHVHQVLETMNDEAACEVQEKLGPLLYFNPCNPTGSYRFNLVEKVDFAMATRLLNCWAVEVQLGLCSSKKLQACWRNVWHNSTFLDTLVIDPRMYDLPRDGVLKLDYVTYDLPCARNRVLRQSLKMCVPTTSINSTKASQLGFDSVRASRSIADVAYELAMSLSVENAVAQVDQMRSQFDEVMRAVPENEEQGAQILSKRGLLSSPRLGFEQPSVLSMRHLQVLIAILRQPQIPAALEVLRIMRAITDGTVHDTDITALLPIQLPRRGGASQLASGGSSAAAAAVRDAEGAGGRGGGKKGSKGGGKKKSKKGKETEGEWPAFPALPQTGIAEESVQDGLNALRIISADFFCTAQMVDLLCQLFDQPQAKMQIVQMFYARIINRSQIAHLMRCLPKDAQILVGQKLGWYNLLNMYSPDMFYVLDITRPDDHAVGDRLFYHAVTCKGRTVNDLVANDKPWPIKEENFKLYEVICEKLSSSATRVLHFDYRTTRYGRMQTAAFKLQEAWKAVRERRERQNARNRRMRAASGAKLLVTTAAAMGISREGSGAPPTPDGSTPLPQTQSRESSRAPTPPNGRLDTPNVDAEMF